MTPKYRREQPSLARNDLILERLKDIKDGQHELEAELQTTKHELKAELQTTKHELKAELQTTKRELNERMDRIENEMRNVARHSQIMTASVVGIALAVVYFVFTH